MTSTNNSTNSADTSRFICSRCHKQFSSRSALEQHQKAMGRTSKIACPYCEQNFTSQTKRDQHIVKMHKTEKCPHCNRKFLSKEALMQHITDKHQILKDCPHCNRYFKSEQALQQHIAAVHTITCPHCDTVFSSQKLLSEHIHGQHINRVVNVFICHDCKQVFKSEEALQEHQNNINHRIEVLARPICPDCGKEFKNKRSLKQHMISIEKNRVRQQNQNEEVACPICEKSFNTKPSLKQHLSANHKRSHKTLTIKRKGIALFERYTLRERIINALRKLFNRKRKIIMDECVGNDISVIDALSDLYDVEPLPVPLIGHSDLDLRLALKEKKWGLVSKDYDMVMRAREMGLYPVYLLTEKRKHRDLIRISKRNYKVS